MENDLNKLAEEILSYDAKGTDGVFLGTSLGASDFYDKICDLERLQAMVRELKHRQWFMQVSNDEHDYQQWMIFVDESKDDDEPPPLPPTKTPVTTDGEGNDPN